jgi:hypothetical protein
MSEKDKEDLPPELLAALGIGAEPRPMPPAVIPDNPGGDYDQARKNIYDALNKANHILGIAIDMVEVSQHPRGIEVVTGLVQTILEGNKDLMELAKKNQEINNGGEGPHITNNLNISTEAFLEMLENRKPKKIE